MKILVDSYNTVAQNTCGGVKVRVDDYIKELCLEVDEVKLFDKWSDKIKDYDILHIFMASCDSYSLVKLAKAQGLKIVVSATLSRKKRFNIHYGLITGRLLHQHNAHIMIKYIFEVSDAIICETQEEKEFLSQNYGIDIQKIYVVPNGINKRKKDVSEKLFRERTKIEGKFILQVGRFDPNKNQLRVIEAVKGTDMQLVFIGGADKDHEEYYLKCKEAAGENVCFLGWINHDDPLLYSAYEAAQVVILPSHHETFGFTLFEGGIYGSNLVATNVLPLKTWGIDECCYPINSYDVNDIRDKLRVAYRTEKNDALSQIISDRFSWESAIHQHIEIFEKILSK